MVNGRSRTVYVAVTTAGGREADADLGISDS
jgi:hypothetical protein